MSMIQSNNHQPGISSATRKTERIQYIDALRGFTMIMVVFCHVSQFCWHVTGKGISIQDFLVQVRMPMFFFISGYVLYKESVVWNGQQVIKFFKKKIPVQLLSPFLFFLVYIFVRHKPLAECLLLPGKFGYWFTYVLLEYYLFYAFIRFCIRSKWAHLVLLALGAILYYVYQSNLYESWPIAKDVVGALSMPMWKYFIFFVMGTLVKRHFTQVEKTLDTPWLLTGCILFYFLVNAFRKTITIDTTLIDFLLTFSGMVILFSFFRNKQAVFSNERALGRTLQYVGRRTLDVYLIHYFFIPRQFETVTNVFIKHPMPIIEATVSLLISILVVAASLLISNVIRLSPVLAHWMFGAKYPVTNESSKSC